VAQTIRDSILEASQEVKSDVDEIYIVNVLIDYLHKKKSKYKATLWDAFGKTIVANLNYNMGYCRQNADIIR
jgi:hypothetical protein